METKKKTELVTGVIEGLDLQAKDVVSYWIETGRLKAADLEEKRKDLSKITVLPSKKIVTPKEVFPGMFMYEDGLIYPDVVQGNRITSIVGAVSKNGGLAVCLQKAELPWSSDYLETGTQEIISGKEATRMIVEAAEKQVKKAEAAQWCYEYAQDGVKAGSAFLASITEMQRIRINTEVINVSLECLCATRWGDGYLWTSTELSTDISWVVYMYNSSINDYTKVITHYVRPVLDFKL